MGNLYAPENLDPEQAVQVSELTSMLPPADMEPGSYLLKVQYLPNRNWETPAQEIPIPPIRVVLSLDAPIQPALELDLSTQFRQFAATLSQGAPALEHIFAEVGRINQYDPTQDYLLQVDRTLSYRLEQEPNRVDWLYGLVLSRVLRQDVPGAIAALDPLTTLEPNSPYPYAYLAVVYLYDWKPQKAQNVLETALQLKPDEPELQALQAVSLAMQGRFFKAWKIAQSLDLI
jgi:tetratricopeptide (TPR) repeat protein